MNDIEAILARHSVRNYKPDRIEEDKVKLLRERIEELNKEGNLHLQLIEDAGATYNRLLNRAMGLGSAPSVIACVGKESDDLDERVGYYGEQLVLYAQKLGLNTCWTGTFSRKNTAAEIGEDERLVICIAIGYGKDQGKQHKSKNIEQVCECAGERPDWFVLGVEMALLAPTAINQQKFVIKLNQDGNVEFINKDGALGLVDIGIVKCHYEIGSGKLHLA